MAALNPQAKKHPAGTVWKNSVNTKSRLVWIASPNEAPGEESDETPKLENANSEICFLAYKRPTRLVTLAGCLLISSATRNSKIGITSLLVPILSYSVV